MKISKPKTTSPTRLRELPPDPPVRLIGWLLALITVLVYLPVQSHEFIYIDDPGYVTANATVQNGLNWAGFKWAFVGWHASNWHPLTWLSHELDCQLFGLNPGAHHLVNVLFHAANTGLLFLLWLRLTKACWPSALVAALFAWHPLHVESVAWVAERKDVLSTFFGLLALLAYARYAERAGGRRAVYYGASLTAFALALLAKPMLVTLPLLMLLLDFWPLRRWPEAGRPPTVPWRLIREKWPFYLMAAGVCLVTILAQSGDAIRTFQQVSPELRLENATMAGARYLGKILWPVNMGMFYPLPRHYAAGAVLLSAVVLAVVSLMAWRGRRSHPWLITGWLWFLVMLLPVIGLVQVGEQSMADRYTYLPAVGLFVAAVFGLARAREKFRWPVRPLVIAAILILGGCVAVTEHQLAYWRNSETLFLHTLAVTTNNGKVHTMLGEIYEAQGRAEEARQQYLAVHAALPETYLNVSETRPTSLAEEQLLYGQDAERGGRPDQAVVNYREALRLDPNLVAAHNNLANLLDDQGRPAEALEHYQAAVRLQPDAPLVHENLGTELVKFGRFDDAMTEYQTAARLDPAKPQPFYLMGKAWLRHGQSGAAVTAFQKALSVDANDCPSLVYLARVLASDLSPQNRDGPRAVSLAEQANRLTGGNQPYILGTLAMAYAEAGRFEDARKTARTALTLAADGDGKTIADLRGQLQLYEADQPFRKAFTIPPAAGHP